MRKIRKNHPPKWLQGTLWSCGVGLLDIEKDKNYIIHQVFAYGTLEEILWLFKTYPKTALVKVFTTIPYKDYFAPRFSFIKNYFLGLKNLTMNENRYVKNIPRDIR